MVQVDGLLYLTNKRVYFQPFHSIYKKPVINYNLKDVCELFKRRYKLLNIGLEFITKKQKSMYLAFTNTDDRDAFYSAMKQYVDDSCITAESTIVEYT
jgi:factor associated with neutral sphingomyelinase activation